MTERNQRNSYLLVFNAQPTGTVISRRYTNIKVDSPCAIKGTKIYRVFRSLKEFYCIYKRIK